MNFRQLFDGLVNFVKKSLCRIEKLKNMNVPNVVSDHQKAFVSFTLIKNKINPKSNEI